jgi:anti-anti-sigma factor
MFRCGGSGFACDFPASRYIDSSGIGELVSGLRAAKRQGASLKLLNVCGRVQDLLKLTKVFPLFEYVGDGASATAGFSLKRGRRG